MTIEEFYKSKESSIEKLASYIEEYTKNETAQEIEHSADILAAISKKLKMFNISVKLKHLILVFSISILLSIPSVFKSIELGLFTFIASSILMFIITYFYWKTRIKINSNYSSFRKIRFDKLNNDIDNANMEGIHQNFDAVKKHVSNQERLDAFDHDSLLDKFIKRYYYNNDYIGFLHMFEDFAYYVDICGRMEVLCRMFNDIRDVCEKIYSQSNDDENIFIEKIIKKFDEEFLKSVFPKITFCNDSKLNKYMLFYICFAKVLFTTNDGIHYDLFICDSFDTMKKLIEIKRENNITIECPYGYIGEQIVATMLVDYGFKLIERDEEVMNS